MSNLRALCENNQSEFPRQIIYIVGCEGEALRLASVRAPLTRDRLGELFRVVSRINSFSLSNQGNFIHSLGFMRLT